MRVEVFPSYLAALAFASSAACSHRFFVLPDTAGIVKKLLAKTGHKDMTPELASTLAAWAMDDPCVTSVYLTTETNDEIGAVLVHHLPGGRPMRFVALDSSL